MLLEIIFNRQMSEFDIYSNDCVTVTAYSASEDETDANPDKTADMTNSRVGLLAVSRDMLDYLNYGQIVILPPFGVFRVSDTMNKRYTNTVDILHSSKASAYAFGKHEDMTLYWVH